MRLRTLIAAISVLGLLLPALSFVQGGQQKSPPQQDQQQQGQQQKGQQKQMDQAQRRQIEERLKAAGFDPGPVDGVFTGETATALLAFQKQRGLPATGLVIVIDEATRQALMQEPPAKAGEKSASQAQESQQAVRAAKASTLIDMPVRNQQGEMLGEVEDVMIDASEGRVAYVILDLGGWFDMGGNLVAAPLEALSLPSDAETLTLNIDKAKLRQAPTVAGPYRPAWPVTVRRPWMVDMYGYYGYPPYSALRAVTPDTLDIASAEAIFGMDVENLQGNDLGEIEDLVIDLSTGRIVYAMLEYGGWLGLGTDLAAVPWKALRPAPDERKLRLDVTEDQLKDIPRFASEEWPQTLDRQWLSDLYARYGEKPYWESQ